jgi:hypothetical protein
MRNHRRQNMQGRIMRLVAALMAACILPGAAMSQGAGAPRSREQSQWSVTKCERYTKAFAEAQQRFGTQGLGQGFLADHAAFLASGCTAQANVCPRSEEELRMANILTIAAMNAGTASTFLPFACRK